MLPPFAQVAPPKNNQVVTTPATALLALGCCLPRRCSARVSLPAAAAEDLHRLPVRDGSGDIMGDDRDRATHLGIAKNTTCEQNALEHQRQSTANLSRWAGSRPYHDYA